MGYGTTQSIKFYPRLGIYKNSTGTVTFDPKSKRADSYTWWVFVAVIKGKLVFNDYNYSQQTSAHQSCVRDVLEELKIKIDVTVYQRESLSNGIEVKGAVYAIEKAKYELSRKGLPEKSRKELESDLKAATKELETLRSKLGVKVPRGMAATIRGDIDRVTKARLENAKEKRKAKAAARAAVKDELNDLAGVNLLEKFENMDDLKTIGEF